MDCDMIKPLRPLPIRDREITGENGKCIELEGVQVLNRNARDGVPGRYM